MRILRIKDWERSFESAETRKLKSLPWTRRTTKFTSKGRSYITAHPRACEILAAYDAMISIAAGAPRRGYLEDHDGPLDAEDMAAIARLPVSAFEIAIEVCTSDKIGWLEVVAGENPEKQEKTGKNPEKSAKVGEGGRTPVVDIEKEERKVREEDTQRAREDGAEQVRIGVGAALGYVVGWERSGPGGAERATVEEMLAEAYGDVEVVVAELVREARERDPTVAAGRRAAPKYLSQILQWRALRAQQQKGIAQTFQRGAYSVGKINV